MNGELAQVVALVAHGNAELVGIADASGLEASNTTFNYVRSITFEVPARRRGVRTVDSVHDWLRAASRWKVDRLSLVRGGGVRPVAFANEGGWGMLGHAPGRVCAWHGSWEVNQAGVDPSDPKPRIWEVDYRAMVEQGGVEPAPVDLEARRTELVEALTDARAFASDDAHHLQNFAPWFDEALEMASNAEPMAPYHPDMLPEVGYSLEARRLLAMTTRAWVFGGMGSWNDVGFSDGETNERYRAISERLYRAVIDAVRDAANAFERP